MVAALRGLQHPVGWRSTAAQRQRDVTSSGRLRCVFHAAERKVKHTVSPAAFGTRGRVETRIQTGS